MFMRYFEIRKISATLSKYITSTILLKINTHDKIPLNDAVKKGTRLL